MKVKELIENLSKCDPELSVCLDDGIGEYPPQELFGVGFFRVEEGAYITPEKSPPLQYNNGSPSQRVWKQGKYLVIR